MATEYGWLIEDAEDDARPGPRYYDLSPDSPAFWTLDHNEAMRFSRKVDAERLCNYLGIEPVRIVEHAWG